MSSTDVKPTSTVTTTTPVTQTTPQTSLGPQFQGLTEQQILMLQQFSVQSRLNHEWSKQ